MHKYTLQFKSIADKRETYDYIEENIIYSDIDEHLTKLKLTLLTWSELTKHEKWMILSAGCSKINWREI